MFRGASGQFTKTERNSHKLQNIESAWQKLPFVPPEEGCRVEHIHRTGPFVTRVELRLPDGTPWVWTSRRHRYLGGIRSLPAAAGHWDDKALWWLEIGLLARIGWAISMLFFVGSACFAVANAALLQAQAELAGAQAELGAPGEDNAQLRSARAALETARLNLEFTRMTASVDGYVTNLNLRLGSQAVANQPVLALVDTASFWVHGYFRETMIADVNPGDRAIVTLMTYPDRPVEGRVDSIGWGISQSDGSTGQDLLPTVSPTFQWIRLAQRIPVRIHLDELPEGVALRVGTTGSVLVMTGTGGVGGEEGIPAVPKALQ